MQYNSTTYNSGEYNFTLHDVNLSDSVTDSDTVTKNFNSLRIESQPSVDALSDAASLAALLETVTILQRASYGAVYNSFEYDGAMYNKTIDTDEVLLQVTKALVDTLTLTDTLAPFSSVKTLLDSLAETDVLVFSTQPILVDFVFLSDFVRREITNKACNETLRLADWLSIERNPANIEWGD